MTKREGILFHPHIPTINGLKTAKCPAFNYTEIRQEIIQTLSSQKVMFSISDIQHSQPDNYLQFSTTFQEQLFKAIQGTNHLCLTHLNNFLQYKAQPPAAPDVAQPPAAPHVDVAHIKQKTMINVNRLEKNFEKSRV